MHYFERIRKEYTLLTKDGLPVGLQIIGRKFRDEDVFAAAHTYEQIHAWFYDVPLNRRID